MNVEKFIIKKPLYPAIRGRAVHRSRALYGMGFYSTPQSTTDMAIKAGIGGVVGYLLGYPLIGAGLGLASAVYSNYKLQDAASLSGCGCCE